MIHLANILKMSWRHFCKTSWKHLEDVFARRTEDFLKTSWRSMGKTNILVLTKTSWRRLENVFWRCMAKASMFVLKTSSEDKDERRLQDVFIKANVWWDSTLTSDTLTLHSWILINLKPIFASYRNRSINPNGKENSWLIGLYWFQIA